MVRARRWAPATGRAPSIVRRAVTAADRRQAANALSLSCAPAGLPTPSRLGDRWR
jgi:hypothetical protein